MSRHEISDEDEEIKSASSADSFCTDEDQRYTGILEEAHDKIKEIERKPIKFWMTASGERREYEFNQNDPIFFMAKATENFGKTTVKCLSCSVTPLKDKDPNVCSFCGNIVCNACYTKQRPFPNAKDKGDRGKICKLCDRKFLVR